LLTRKSISVIIGSSAAAAILLVVMASGQLDMPEITPTQMTEDLNIPVVEKQTQEQIRTYRINTECVVDKYPEFGPWEAILRDNQTRAEFFKQPLSEDFSDVLVGAVMSESSINPELDDIASLVADPQGRAKLQQAFQEFNCKAYFDERAN
jgi:hypothetical protein